MIKQRVYNMIFKKILSHKHISNTELVPFIRESISEKDFGDTELAYVLDLIKKNPNISSGTQMSNDTAIFTEYWWIGPDIVIFEDDENNKFCETQNLTDIAISIIKNEGKIGVQDLIIKLGRLYRNVSASDIMRTINALQYNNYGIKINGSIYPYEPGTEFIYNGLPTLEEFTKDLPHTEIVNMATKSEPKYICPDCGGDVRKRLDIVLTSNPVKYRYECDNNPDCKYVAFHEV